MGKSKEYQFYMGLVDNCIDAFWSSYMLPDLNGESLGAIARGALAERHYNSTGLAFQFTAKAYARYHNIFKEADHAND